MPDAIEQSPATDSNPADGAASGPGTGAESDSAIGPLPQALSVARPSPLQAALDRVGDRWCLLVVESLLDGPLRFNELQTALPGIAPNILSDRLKRLERERVLTSRPYSERPVRLTYELTAEGRELAGALRLLADWGARADPSDALRHGACGTPLEARWYCPTCARAIGENEATELRRL
jgi:DNA-binding HxlR family transcriptional regulator